MNLKLINIIFGFFILFLSSCGGFFLAIMTETALNQDKHLFSTSLYMLQKSAHSHTNLFGIIHIVFALTLKESQLSIRIKTYQSISLFLGSFSMCFLMIIRSLVTDSHMLGAAKYFSVVFLCLYTIAILSHCYGVLRKLVSELP